MSILPLALLYESEDIDDIEVVDAVIISDKLESVDIGGAGALHGTYLRVTGPDLVAAADGLRRLADRIIDVVLDARTERIDLDRHYCPGECGTFLEADEVTCRRESCDRRLAQEMAL